MQISSAAAIGRRHDLDALRAFAMLLGIALHGALSFIPMPWPVQDGQQHGLFGWLVSAVHGFRMPVFFVMSGFFTAMLWRRRGLRSLLGHRFRRIFLPLLLGTLTVVPAVEWVSRWAIGLGPGQAPPTSQAESDATPETGAGKTEASEATGDVDPATGLTSLSLAALGENADDVRRLLEAGAPVNGPNRDGSTPLILAAVFGRAEAVGLLLEAGADLDARSADASTALHTAAFFGHAEVVELLLAAGADLSLVNGYGQTPPQVLGADWQTTAFIAQMVGVELVQEELEAGRTKIAELLASAGAAPAESAESHASASLAQLMYKPFFHHLWFLWFLCFLVAAFAAYASLADRLGWKGQGLGFVLSPLHLLWLVPITCLPQFFMGRLAPVFGADTSAGLLPMPHVLAYYAIFFFFGALYFDAGDDDERVGRWWFLSLPLGLFVLFPIGAGIAFVGVHNIEPGVRVLGVLLQAAYPWVMTFGLMGLFRRLLARERPGVRYLSDASYWLYLTHLPLILVAQVVVRDWSMPAVWKFVLICLSVTAVLLVLYQTVVRYGWIGRLLNGPRQRSGKVEVDGHPGMNPRAMVR